MRVFSESLSSKHPKTLLGINSPIKQLIVRKVSNKYLNERLKIGLKNKTIPQEQMFRKPENWTAVTTSDKSYKIPRAEHEILIESSGKLRPFLKNSLKIFYGIGRAVNETLIVKWDLEANSYAEVCGIDVTNIFIKDLIQKLRHLKNNYPQSKIFFKGYNAIFEDITKGNLSFSNSTWRRATHICFGNTIGNFDQEEIFKIFKRNMNRGDYLLLGFQLAKNPEKILSVYANNFPFQRFVLDSIGFTGRKLLWKYNKDKDRIEAWSGDILVYYSKKYNMKKFLRFISKFNLSPVKVIEKADFAICLLEKSKL